ncbi:RNA polymerase sigma factor (sigma-70 family) [Flavobacterium sp. 90]|uniref:RNA polymerase sigma factor n=1 Tax=unclassified Flavobacterium TaxID=196869 RepID=UPI000EB4BB9B|nr:MULTISPECIES: sigma-70 family RNA polymerase sigma factor [unclassified Flavobacterium]RKR12021.1 RNA polymerase sigma factor (sigma-70 family) [Flavobacterium sp. 81]TCK55793.1 RNA polymerase sigma factor (sigma-70 family) [Flavobacterium sp. 90]
MENVKKDIDLWSQIKKGDVDAYHKLYDRYVDLLYTFGINYTNDEALVQDAIHDIFVDLYRYRKNLADEVIVKSYLFKSIQRDIFKKLKSQTKVVRLDSVAEGIYKTDSAEDELISSETTFTKHANLALALTSLSKKQRQALHLRFTEDQSYEEISSTLEITLESCRTLIYRALKELRKKL